MENKPILHFEDEKQFQDTLKYWIDKLMLFDWVIVATRTNEVLDVDSCEDDDICWGYTRPDFENKTARIQIYTGRINEDDPIAFQNFEELTLVHELVHLRFGLMKEGTLYEDLVTNTHQHSVIESFAKSLILAKYDLTFDYFK